MLLPSARLTCARASNGRIGILAVVPGRAEECRHVRGFPVGMTSEAADLWDFCGAKDSQFKLFPDRQEHPDDAARGHRLTRTGRATSRSLFPPLPAW